MKLKEFDTKHNHSFTEEFSYRKPKQPEVQQSLQTFQDEKFGLMVHWGLYSTLGVTESWCLPDSDRAWGLGNKPEYLKMSGEEFRQLYFGQIKHFNPDKLDPTRWAKVAKDAGFKYFLFTTKHHDGFCMWDTAATDFKVTAVDCPYHTSPNADICKSLFDAFRAEGIKIHAYFSKSDWHSPHYWDKKYVKNEYYTPFPTYNRILHRKEWLKFRAFVKTQMLELVNNYGRIECLWLDGGQVRPSNAMGLKLLKTMKEARTVQPWLMIANRTVGGRTENFITPEQTIPDHVIRVPWESCVTLGGSFAYVDNDVYKSPAEVIAMLCDIVAKGGNLALNVAPDGSGEFPPAVYPILAEIGRWLKENGYAIYGTRPVAPYRFENFAYTCKGNDIYAIYLAENTEPLPQTVRIKVCGQVQSVGFGGNETSFIQNGDEVVVDIPDKYDEDFAYVFTIKMV